MSVPENNLRPYVLLTGASGLVGGLVLARLLESEVPVAVMVRGNRRQTAAQRVEALMRRLEERFQRLFGRPVVIDSDLCATGLGLSSSDRDWIAQNCGSIIHSAANLLFSPASKHPDNEPYRTNVDGTRHLFERTTALGIREWHYVSTAYIAGLRDGTIYEHESNVGQTFGNDYERSKAMAEQMLRTSNELTSLTVYRPSIVIDLHPTTSMRSDQTINSAFTMFQALSQRFGLPERGDWFRRLGFDGAERKNIVTVDWVAALIAEIWRRPQLHGRTYHLTNPYGTSAAELEDGFRAAVLNSGAKLPAARPEAMAQIDEQAAPFVAAFKPYFKDDPKFDRSNTLQAMRVCDEADLPELNVNVLRDFCLRQTKSVPPAPPIALSESRWSNFASDFARLQLTDASNAIGLELCGPGGGQWIVEESSAGFGVISTAASIATTRWICAASTWDALIDGRVDVEAALRDGVLLWECDGAIGERQGVSPPSDACQKTQLGGLTPNRSPEDLKRLLTAIRNRSALSAFATPEVTHVR